jgi:tRNA (cytidine/uridine-2'-O-)-methyltransferase
MDYLAMAGLTRHVDWSAFEAWRTASAAGWCCSPRAARTPLWDFTFLRDDVLLFGRESAGVPEAVHAAPMRQC